MATLTWLHLSDWHQKGRDFDRDVVRDRLVEDIHRRAEIDPSLAGVENNPQARLTIEQQITPNITFTYITNVTNSNPLVIQVEWAISRKWSVVAVRDENGLFGMDFLYKRRF